MRLSDEHKKEIYRFALCLLASILLALVGYFVTKLPDTVQQALFFGLIILLAVALFRVNWRRDHKSFGRGVESESAYAILGVDAKASGEEIRRAYRALARKHHPDNYPDDQKSTSTALLLRVNRAYEMIGDEDTRFEYDTLMRFHDPSAPPFDEAYAHFLEWRNQEGNAYRDVEYWGDPLADLYGEEKPDDVAPEGLPEPTDDHSNQEVPSSEPTATLTQPPSAGECPACGEPYRTRPELNGPVHCERCGEQLSGS
jgi:DnaJ domain